MAGQHGRRITAPKRPVAYRTTFDEIGQRTAVELPPAASPHSLEFEKTINVSAVGAERFFHLLTRTAAEPATG